MANPIVSITGSREPPKCQTLASTGIVTLLSAPAKGWLTTESIRWTCAGTGTDLSIWLSDGSTNFPIKDAEAIAANESGVIEDHYLLRYPWSIKAQAAAADEITTTIVFVLSGQSGTNTGA